MNILRLVKLQLWTTTLNGSLGRALAAMTVITLGLATTLGDFFSSGKVNGQGLFSVWPLALIVYLIGFLPLLTPIESDTDWLSVEPISRFTRDIADWLYCLLLWTIIELVTLAVCLPWILSSHWDGGLLLSGYLAGLGLGLIGIAINRTVYRWIKTNVFAQIVSVAVLLILLTIDNAVWLKGIQFLIGSPAAQILSGLSVRRVFGSISSGYLTLQDLFITLWYGLMLFSASQLRLSELSWRNLTPISRLARRLGLTSLIIFLFVGIYYLEISTTHGVDITYSQRYTLAPSSLNFLAAEIKQSAITCNAEPPSDYDHLIFKPQPRMAVMVNDQLTHLALSTDLCKPEARIFNELSLVITGPSGSASINSRTLHDQLQSWWPSVIGALAVYSGLEPLTLCVSLSKDSDATLPDNISSESGTIRVVDLASNPNKCTAIFNNAENSIAPEMSSNSAAILSDQLPWNAALPPLLNPNLSGLFKTHTERDFEQKHLEQSAIISSTGAAIVSMGVCLLTAFLLLILVKLIVTKTTYRTTGQMQ